jgi:hypothetical protein
MSQDHKRSFFASLFGSKSKNEEQLEAEKESRQKLEARIREVLAINDAPELPEPNHAPTWEPVIQAKTESLELVYGGSSSVHSSALLQSGQFGTHAPQHESDSNLRIVPARETFHVEAEQPGIFQAEEWHVRQKAANG